MGIGQDKLNKESETIKDADSVISSRV